MNKTVSLIMIAFITVMIYLSISFFKQDNSGGHSIPMTSSKSNTLESKKMIHIKYTDDNSKVIKKYQKQKILSQKKYANQYSTDDEDSEYSVTFLSQSHIEKKDANIPLHLNIGNKKVTLSMPLAKFDDINNSKLIIKDKNNRTVAQILPYFMDDIGTNNEITMDINPSTHKINAIHINKIYKSNGQYSINTNGYIPNF